MSKRLLVLSTVHPADDPRIRHKLIGTLQDDWDVTFAGKGVGPINSDGIIWRELPGGRLRRWLGAGRLLLGRRFDVASVHDPELLPLALLAALFGRTIVFDVHENVPAQLRTKPWLPRPVRSPLASIFGRLFHVAEKHMAITLAESGYGELFRRPHPVFPNYLIGAPPPPRAADPTVGVVYLGDVTEARGLAMAVEAVGRAGVATFTIMGRCAPDFRAKLLDIAARHSVDLRLHGYVTLDRALEITSVGQLGLSPLLDTPNYRNSLPTKVLEYLAVGVPTLASDLPGTRRVIAGRRGVILVRPGDTEAWSQAIVSSIGNEALRQEARDGAAAIRDEYAWPESDVREFYASLAAE